MNRVELLIPAKDCVAGQMAINHGADAVYIGAAKFGARQAAGNALQDLERLVSYSHLYGAKTYVTVNTLLYDEELPEARKLIQSLYDMGVDALIIQDLGILKLDLPPIRLHASTQCHNHSLERISFLQKAGFKRAILAREMDLETVRAIHSSCDIELEAFVHGALCVSYSGQCYMSRLVTDRSGNRGECAQLCRTCFDLEDGRHRKLVAQKHLLSLKDMNRSAFIQDMIAAGIVSLKVEGRLKDEHYVKNITAYYRQCIDRVLEGKPELSAASSGKTSFFFTPNPRKTFNRGFTPYFIQGQREKMASLDTPKAMGQWIGTMRQDRQGRILYEGKERLANGDGLCFINERGELEGFRVNRAERNQIFPQREVSLVRPVDVYRNVDKVFEKQLHDKTAQRKIAVDMLFKEMKDGFMLQLTDEDGCMVSEKLVVEKTVANQAERAMQQLRTSLAKTGATPFEVRALEIDSLPCFLPNAVVNKLRNAATDSLQAVRIAHFRPTPSPLEYQPEPLVEKVTYKQNVTNALHRAVYEDFGAVEVEHSLDQTLDFKGKEVMVCKYCLRYEMGMCSKQKSAEKVALPLYIRNEKHRFRLEFDCRNCVMKVISE